MKRFLCTLLFLPALLYAKPKASPEQQYLEKNVARAGGLAAFQRLATFSCRFEETVRGSSGPVTVRGRWYLRMNDGKGLRMREEVEGGAVTIVASTSAAAGRGAALLREAFWTFAPQWIRAEARPLSMLPDGFLAHRLSNRMSVGGPAFFPGGEGLTLFLDRAEGMITGAAAGADVVSFHNFEATQGFLTLPAVRVYHDAAGKQVRVVKISDVAVNGYLDEKLFTSGDTP